MLKKIIRVIGVNQNSLTDLFYGSMDGIEVCDLTTSVTFLRHNF